MSKAKKAATEKKPAKAKAVKPVQAGSKKVEHHNTQAWERGESIELAKAE